MPNESAWTIWWLDTWEWVRKDSNKVTEQDVKRAQSDSSQAKKVQTQIKKQKITNNNIANFLSFLFKTIKNENILSSIYNTFFKVTNKRTNTSYIRKSMNNIVIIWFFVPFFPKEVENFWLKNYFQDICKLNGKQLTLNEYILYIKKLSKKYHDNIPIDQDHLLELLALIVLEFWISNESLNADWIKKIKNDLIKKLK